jgi:phosphoribosylaminoimidazolecarboxamide formyltransferase/IMP cyclohydrolase
VEAFQHTATYDVNVATWLSSVVSKADGETDFPNWIGHTYDIKNVLRYGEILTNLLLSTQRVLVT